MPPRTRPQLPQVGEDGLPTSVADWIQEAVSALDQLRWRVSEADYQMRNPNAIIDTLQRKYEKDVAPLLGDSQKRRKPRIPPMQAPQMSRMRTSAGLTLDILDEAERESAAARAAFDRETANKSDCVHSLATHGALERLKEAALLYCYSKEPWAELDVE